MQSTRLESDEDIRRALQGGSSEPLWPTAPLEGQPAPADDAPRPYRPTKRPPTPILTVCDDGSEEGERLRVRQEVFVIGRSEGDLMIPHDGLMSNCHAELRQTVVQGKRRCALVDLKSTNGTFVRIGHAVLDHGSEFVIGRTRLRFENPTPEDKPPAAKRGEQTTQAWQPSPAAATNAAVIEVSHSSSERRVLLNKAEVWIGKDSDSCQMVLADDPFASARHARIRRDEEGRWLLENNRSVNGVWLKVEQIVFKGACRFMLGEQKFIVRV